MPDQHWTDGHTINSHGLPPGKPIIYVKIKSTSDNFFYEN